MHPKFRLKPELFTVILLVFLATSYPISASKKPRHIYWVICLRFVHTRHPGGYPSGSPSASVCVRPGLRIKLIWGKILPLFIHDNCGIWDNTC